MAFTIDSLGHAVAAADLGRVGHGGGPADAGVAGVAEVVLAEHQRARGSEEMFFALPHQVEVPGAVGRVAVQAGADQHVVADRRASCRRRRKGSLITISSQSASSALPDAAPMKLPAENRSMPVTFSLVRGLRAEVAADAELGRGASRRPCPARTAARPGRMRCPGARRIHPPRRCAPSVIGLHGVVDTTMPRLQYSPIFSASATLGRMPAAITTRSAGTSSAVLEAHRDDPRARSVVGRGAHLVAEQFLGVGTDQEPAGHATSSDLLQQACPPSSSSWRSISQGGDVHHRHLTCRAASGRWLPPGRAGRRRSTTACLYFVAVVDHRVGVGDVAVGDHALQFACPGSAG